jgi:hypothetical protein
MRLTDRDIKTIDLVFWGRVLQAEQLRIGAGYPLTSETSFRRRLDMLTDHRYVDILPRRVAGTYIYVLTRRSTAGKQLMLLRWGEEAAKRQLSRRPESLDHLLAINDVRVRMSRACLDLGFTLTDWQSSGELAPRLQPYQLIPDGFWQIIRRVGDKAITSSFFLEVERLSRDLTVMRKKLIKYGELYYSGDFTKLFGSKALRLLVVFDEGSDYALAQRIIKSVAEAAKLEVTIAHFATLPQMKALPPTACLTSPLWQTPRAAEPLSIFPATPEFLQQAG